MNPDESLVRQQPLPLPPATATAICTAAPAASTPHRSAKILQKHTVLQFRFVFKLCCYFGHDSVKGYDLPYERIARFYEHMVYSTFDVLRGGTIMDAMHNGEMVVKFS
jgi:hypothetical protein